MCGNSFGRLFRITTFGESHGAAVGVVIDGCPAGFPLNLNQIQAELDRRRPGQSKLVSPRREPDELEMLSGLFEGKTTGAPLMAIVHNKDVRSKDYGVIKDLFRPGHADFGYFAKYRHRDYRGGGRSSARETVGRVIAGAVAKQLLFTEGILVRAGVVQIGKVQAENRLWQQVTENELCSLDPAVVPQMIEQIEQARKKNDSVGGVLEVRADGVYPGLGEPVFDKLDAAIGQAMLSIPAVKGVEIGAGFSSASLLGSEMNDEMLVEGFASNNHGGILGGLSSGAPIIVRIAIKPTSSIALKRRTIDCDFKPVIVSTKGRHDPCVALRAVPIAEAMLALVIVDFWLQDLAARGARARFAPIEPLQYGLAEDAADNLKGS